MHKLLLALLCSSLIACSTKPIQKPAVLTEALSTARLENKVVVVDFGASWCGWCTKLDQDTWGDSSVQKWFDAKGVLVKLDAEREPALAKHYDVKGYPTIVFLKADGSVIESLTGYRDPNTFLAEVRRIVPN